MAKSNPYNNALCQDFIYLYKKINRDEYKDDFRRIQEESRNLSKEDVSRYHRGANSRDYDDTRRSLEAVYGGLLSRNLTSSVGSRSLTSEKNGTISIKTL